ncbi:MAG: hypothetical protein ACR2QQ_12110 [Gammaproteobacteria bacterium]
MNRSWLLLSVLIVGTSQAQGWIEYVDVSDRFLVHLPGEPVIEETTYLTDLGVDLPARIYSVSGPSGDYSLTVVRYTEANRVHQDRCDRSPNLQCDGLEAGIEVRGSIAFAAWNIRQRTEGDITYDGYAQVDGIPGHQLQIVNPDGSQSFVAIHLEARRLYLLEATVPQSSAPPIQFQQSLGIMDADRRRIRYVYDENDNKVRVETSVEWIQTGENSRD